MGFRQKSRNLKKGQIDKNFVKDAKLPSGSIWENKVIISIAMDMKLLVNGATTTVWVMLVMTKHPQSHAHAQLNLNPLYMTSHQQIGFLTWTRPQESFRIDVDTWRLREFCCPTSTFFIYMFKIFHFLAIILMER